MQAHSSQTHLRDKGSSLLSTGSAGISVVSPSVPLTSTAVCGLCNSPSFGQQRCKYFAVSTSVHRPSAGISLSRLTGQWFVADVRPQLAPAEAAGPQAPAERLSKERGKKTNKILTIAILLAPSFLLALACKSPSEIARAQPLSQAIFASLRQAFVFDGLCQAFVSTSKP